MTERVLRMAAYLAVWLIAFTAITAAFGGLVYAGWNNLAVPIAGAPAITFLQAWGAWALIVVFVTALRSKVARRD